MMSGARRFMRAEEKKVMKRSDDRFGAGQRAGKRLVRERRARGLNHLRADAIAQRDRIRKRKAAREPQQNGARVRVPRADGIRHALDLAS